MPDGPGQSPAGGYQEERMRRGLLGFIVILGLVGAAWRGAAAQDGGFGANQAREPVTIDTGKGTETPVAADADVAEGDETPERERAEVSAADCDWAEETLDRLNALAPVGEELQGMDDDPDPERLREIADDLADAAAEQRDSDPPAVADEANEQIAAAFDLYANALDSIADAIDEGETPDTVALLADVREANGLIADAGEVTSPLLAECGVS